MDSFFDLREFLVSILKRLKFIVVVTFCLAVGWALARFIPLAMDYFTYDVKAEKVAESGFLTQEEQPYVYQARRTLYIEPQYLEMNGTITDQSAKVGEAYAAFCQNKEILEPLLDKYYEETKQVDAGWKQKMVDCNYRTKLVFNEEYKVTHFYGHFTVECPSSNIINLRASTGDEELSERMVEEFERLLTDYVASKMGAFDYTITEGQLGMWLPTATSGLTPKTSNSNTQVVKGIKPEPSFIVTRTIKGAIWGTAAGLALSILCTFFFSIVGTQIESEQDLKKFGLPLLAMLNGNKRRFLGFIDKWVDKLEGRVYEASGMELCCKMLYERLKLDDPSPGAQILLSGCCDVKLGEEIAQNLSGMIREEHLSWSVSFSPCVTYHPETVAACDAARQVVLVEQAGLSNKAEIEREIEQINVLKRPIKGFVLLKNV